MAKTVKLDLFAKHKKEYTAKKEPSIVTVKPYPAFTILGKGRPGNETFGAKLQALYGLAYTTKFAKKAVGKDYKVAPLEGMFWAAKRGGDFLKMPSSEWRWKLFIRVPTYVTAKDRTASIQELKEKGKTAAFADVKLETIDEGRCAQILHIGPYSEEDENIRKLHAFVESQGLKLRGRHHEIYLSDPNRTKPERLRTIIRNPVR